MAAPAQGVRRDRPSGIPLSTVWVVAAFAIPVTAVLALPIDSVDLAYLVRAGRIMLRSGELLQRDVFLFTTRCAPWTNQQWASEVALAGAYAGLGWLGLAVVRAALVAAILAFVHATCRAHGATPRSAAALTLLAAGLALGGLQLRAQLVGLVLFAALLWVLAGRRTHPRRLFLAVPILLVWANAHGSFPIGVVVLAAAAVEDARSRAGLRTAVVAALAAAATVVTPFGVGVWEYVVDLSTNPVVREVVTEWQPPWRTLSYSGVAFLASAAIGGWILWRDRRELPRPVLATLAALLALGLTSVRTTFWWDVSLCVTLARLPWARRPARADPRNRTNLALAAMLAAIPLVALTRWLPYPADEPPPRLVSHAPPGVTVELRSLLEPGEPFENPQSWGSWFELALPGHLLFVDSRFEVMPPSTVRLDRRLAAADPGWEAQLDRLPVRVVVVDLDREAPFARALAASATWREVYRDDDGAVFVRDDRAPTAVRAACEG